MTEPASQPPSPDNLSKPGSGKLPPISILKAENPQLAVNVWQLNGKRQSWPYAHLVTHTLQGGLLTIWFTGHFVRVYGRHLEEAYEGLRLQSLVFLKENGTRRRDLLGEPEIPEDQPAIDRIEVYDLDKA